MDILQICGHPGMILAINFKKIMAVQFLQILSKSQILKAIVNTIDPFAGSNATGYASEKLKRKWIGIDSNYEYITGSQFRFAEIQQNTINK
jgi:DNA modification methylase